MERRRVDEERLSAVDRANLLVERSGPPMHIGVVAMLAPGSAVDEAALRDRIAERAPAEWRRALDAGPRLPRRWVDAPLDPDRHMRRIDMPAGTDRTELMNRCCGIVLEPFTPGRAPWELVILDRMPDGRVAVLLRLHHVFADGIAALPIMAPLFDDASPSAGDPRRVGRRRGSAGSTLRAWFAQLATVSRAATHPPVEFARPVGPHRRIRTLEVAFPPLRATAHRADARIDDLLLDVCAAGARALLEADGSPIRDRPIVASLATTLRRPGDRHSNDVGVTAVPLPIDELDAAHRLEAIRRSHARARAAVVQPSGLLLQRLMRRAMYRQRLVHLVVSNVPGPPTALHLLGATVESLTPIGLLQGNLSLAVVALSYGDRFTVSVLRDPDAVPRGDVFADAAFARLRELVAA